MAGSESLRRNKRQHVIKNSVSKKMDKDIDVAVRAVMDQLRAEYPDLNFEHQKTLALSKIISELSQKFSQHAKNFSPVMESSFLKPDGGFLYATRAGTEIRKLILIAEVKRQGTNDKRLKEGLPKQARGNAIERLGKNLIGVRTIFRAETIIPFVCFGSGDDLQEGCSILDRVITMNEFFPMNRLFVLKEHPPFEPVSMFFRYEDWTIKEMTTTMKRISEIAIRHYFK